ncbi:hypothetical protein [Bordetella trematum]|uniref:hypothetical protein n=1 Tax=Bordetella trematum TaxID=123899 RepID=UPI00398935B6
MKEPLVLTIAVASLLSLESMAAEVGPAPAGAPTQAVEQSAHGGGKCASGKCGTEKIYSRKSLEHDPQGLLVRARDGRCGLSGEGHDVALSEDERLAQGVCGQ